MDPFGILFHKNLKVVLKIKKMICAEKRIGVVLKLQEKKDIITLTNLFIFSIYNRSHNFRRKFYLIVTFIDKNSYFLLNCVLLVNFVLFYNKPVDYVNNNLSFF